MVSFFKNCSDMLWEKKCSSDWEWLEQILKQKTGFFNLLLETSSDIETIKMTIESNTFNGDVET